jgi:meso-butanediol dehydrogenase/(S,S)-butanediol dehydrogenase/diacetyl reductase
VAVVTGAGAGIGRGTAERLAHDGFHVVAIDLDGAAADQAADALLSAGAPEPMSAQADVSDRPRAKEIVAQVLKKYGRIDARWRQR